jgi:alpha-galactosidase
LATTPAAVQAEYKPALKAALAAAARAHEPGVPLDWMDTTPPERWRLDGKTVRYNWYEEDCPPRACLRAQLGTEPRT